jgi:hypothetical protein
MMGMQNQNSASGGQVYYDSNTGQYYTTNQQQNNPTSNPLVNFFTGALSPNSGRNYIGSNPLNNNTYTPMQNNTTIAPYPTTESLFPGLNAGLTQNMQSTASSMPSSGAGRFLSSGLLSNNTSKGQ